jgi:hypothetical protein
MRIHGTIIANTLSDFKVKPTKDSKEKKGGWIQFELISLASAIIPDDLTKSPLASLFSMSKMIQIVPMTPSEQFLAAWFSELRSGDPKNAPDSIHELYRTLTNYNSLPIEVYPLSVGSQKEPISLRYRNQIGPPRAYQKFGFFDFEKPVDIEPEDLKAAIIQEKDFSLEGFDPKESVVSAEIEKIFREADAIIITANDFPSLASMLSYKDVRKSIKKTNGTVITVSPIGKRVPLHSPREEPLLQIFGITPDVHGFLELMTDVSDIIVIDEADSEYSSIAQETGFNVVVGDLTDIEANEEFMALVMKAAGLDVSTLIPDISESAPAPSPSLQKLEHEIKQVPGLSPLVSQDVDTQNEQSSDLPENESTLEVAKPEIIDTTEDDETETRIPKDETPVKEVEPSITESMASHSSHSTISSSKRPKETVAKKPTTSRKKKSKKSKKRTKPAKKEPITKTEDSDGIEETDVTTQSIDSTEGTEKIKTEDKIETTITSDTDTIDDTESIDQVSSQVDENGLEADETQSEELEETTLTPREFISHTIKEIEQDEESDLDQWVEDIQETVEKDESLEVQAAQGLIKLISGVLPEKVRSNALKVFMKLAEERTITFRRVVQSWLDSELNNPDFSIQDQQNTTLIKMASNNSNFVGSVLEAFVNSILTSDLSPAQAERARSLILRVGLNSKKLSRFVIKSYLNLYDDEKANQENIWPTLSSFDARLVAIELMELDPVISNKVSKEGLEKELGSFSVLLDEIITYWQQGDIDSVLSICGSLSESALRKARRLNLAQNIKKIGTIPLDTLARSLKEDAKELEALVYEMVMNDEIAARLEIVDGRLYIIQIDANNNNE